MKKQFSEPQCREVQIGCEDIMYASNGWFTHEINFVTDEDISKGPGEFTIS